MSSKRNFNFSVSDTTESCDVSLAFGNVYLANGEKGQTISKSLEVALARNNPFIAESRYVRSLDFQKNFNPSEIKLESGAFSYTLSVADAVTDFKALGNVLWKDSSLGAIFNLAEPVLSEFKAEARPCCPHCGTSLTKEIDFSFLSTLTKGVVVVTFRLSSSELPDLTLAEISEMYGINYFVLASSLVRADADDLQVKKIAELTDELFGVLLTEALPLKSEAWEKVKEEVARGFALGEVQLFFFENRRAKAQKLQPLKARPYCVECQCEVSLLSEVPFSAKEILSAKSELNKSWYLNEKNLLNLQGFNCRELVAWANGYKSKVVKNFEEVCEILTSVNLAERPLKQELSYFSQGEKIRIALALLLKLDLQDSVLFFKGLGELFVGQEKEQYFNVVKQLAEKGNICIVLEREQDFCASWIKSVEPFVKVDKLAVSKVCQPWSLSVADFASKLKTQKFYVLEAASGGGKTAFQKELIQYLKSDESFVTKDFFSVEVSAGTLAGASGVGELLAELYASTAEARLAGLEKKDFLFGSSKYRCQYCAGSGVLGSEFESNEDFGSVCPACLGLGFLEPITNIKVKAESVATVLEKSVTENAKLFIDNTKLYKKLLALQALGFGSYKLKTPCSVLSQMQKKRLVLANELCKARSKKVSTLFVLDDMLLGLEVLEEALDYFKGRQKAGDAFLIASNSADVLSQADVVFVPKS